MSGLEARIAEVHVAHLGHVFTGVGPDGSRWYDSCVCGVELFGEDNSPEHRMYPGVSYAESAHAAHISQMLAPLIREAQAEALAGAAKYFDNRATMFIEGDLPAADERRGAYTAEAQHAAAMLTHMADNLGAPDASNT